MTGSGTALIVGAGIGGLAAAIALRKAGWQVRVHERAAAPRELGFALALAPNAMAALRELGVADVLAADGAAVTKAEIRHPDGRVVRRFSTQPGGPMIVALRTALHGSLLEAVGGDMLRLGSEAIGYRASPQEVVLELRDGGQDAGDVLIGADGVGSIVRRRLHPAEAPPRPSGYCAVRGIAFDVGHNLGDLAAVAFLGDGVEAAAARASRNAVYWYLSLLADDLAGSRDPKAILEQTTRGFDPAFRAITGATTIEDMRFDQLFERDPLPSWGSGRVTLLGDAAHPVLPHTGQGAAQSLEDAVALGLALSRNWGIGQSLREYERIRSRRTRRFVKLGPRIARVTTTRNRVVQWSRTLAIRVLPEALIAGKIQRPPKDPHRELRSG